MAPPPQDRRAGVPAVAAEEGRGGASRGRRVVLLSGLLAGAAMALALVVKSGGPVALHAQMDGPRPQLVPLPIPRVWSVPAPPMLPGRLQQLLVGNSRPRVREKYPHLCPSIQV